MTNIGISIGKARSLRDGLGELATQLCKRFAAVAPQLRRMHDVELFVHMHPDLAGHFGDELHYLPAKKIQRYLPWSAPKFDLWHRMDHFNRLKPPIGAKMRAVTIHDLNYAYSKGGASRKRGEQRIQRALDGNKCFATNSWYVREDIGKQFQSDAEVEVVHCGARSLVDTIEREPIGAFGVKPFLFHLSRMSPSKNVGPILELARAWPEMNFVFAGPERSDTLNIRQALKDAPLPNVEIHLSITDGEKAWLYANCAGFVFPSLTEGFGLPPIEAMHFGKPVFLSKFTSLPEVGGDAAHYFETYDPDSMRALIEPAVEPATSAANADLVRANAARFNWDDAARNYLCLYGKWIGLDFSNIEFPRLDRPEPAIS
ncbi:MAG: glycosyltransferase involved in cell wall biosynthesis [Planctomycetota bacterium]|jgi:glycosyltransferase involved in cell wall biosynthesis